MLADWRTICSTKHVIKGLESEVRGLPMVQVGCDCDYKDNGDHIKVLFYSYYTNFILTLTPGFGFDAVETIGI